MFSDDLIQDRNKVFLNSEHMGDYVTVGDWRIHYYTEGEGSPLLLVHGLGQSLYTWRKIIRELAKKHRVFAIDLPGAGYSSKQADFDYTVEAVAELIVRFMDTIALKETDAVGFSGGGIYLLRAVQLHPRRFARIGLISPGGMTPEMPFFMRALANPALSWLYRMMISPESMRKILSTCFFDQTQVTDEMVRENYSPLEGKESRRALCAMLQDLNEEDTMQSLRDLRHEVLLLWGTEDQWHDELIAQGFNMSLPSNKLVLVRNCGHILHEEKPERCLKELDDFFAYGLEGPPPVRDDSPFIIM